MRLLPFGPCLPVHCCCEPGKRLGWVPVPKRLQYVSARVSFVCGPAKTMRPLIDDPTPIAFKRLDTQVEQLSLGHLAVNSNDIPIDDWRKVPGFIEDRNESWRKRS